jgi:putative transposase
MILTFKIRHNRDFSHELALARKVAKFALATGSRTSSDVKHIGLKSMIANQILKKYSRNKVVKRVRNVVLTIPSQGIKVDREMGHIAIPCVKLSLWYQFRNDFEKINQIEINSEYAFVSVTIPEPVPIDPTGYIGVDLNTTGHTVVVGNPGTGKVLKMGKQAEHVHKKYKNIRRNLQKKGKYGLVKRIKSRESRIVRDMNHKMSKGVVRQAEQQHYGIKMEDLKGIRNTTKSARSFRYSLNSWSFYQFQKMIEYKAKLHGIPLVYIDPAYTSQFCSRCGLIGNRNGKGFSCPHCGHVDNADVNASFNIATRPEGAYQSCVDRDAHEESTGTSKEAIL